MQLILDTPGQDTNVHFHSCCRLDDNEGAVYCCDNAAFGQLSQLYHDSLIKVSKNSPVCVPCIALTFMSSEVTVPCDCLHYL